MWSEERRRLARRIVVGCCIVAALAVALFLVPIPWIIFGPGAAVDLNDAVSVPKHAPPPGHFYLTDVALLPGRPAFLLAARTLPGFEAIRRQELVPPNVTDRDLDRQLVDAMAESQINAQIVAERAAGLRVKADSYFAVLKTVRGTPAARCFRRGDRVWAIDGKPVQDPDALSRTTVARPPGTSFSLTVSRGGTRQTIACATVRYKGKPRFGMTGQFGTEAARLPVKVSYRLPNINGSSAGLMFALQIYRTLTGRDIGRGRDIAGTGVLGTDGTVLPIEGAREKIQAAIKTHAVLFLVPQENYAQVRDTPGIRVVAVKSFRDALRVLDEFRPAMSRAVPKLTAAGGVPIIDEALPGAPPARVRHPQR
ncbi:MAG: PDZ domain-containing protein [Candidatus Eremiobacteraeota bacterium]|nr:PDZ domain-containing protein [Candidatus Eremiobacteraeota bacterium]